MTNTSHKYAGNLSFYDYVIDAGGEGDATSIATGLTAAGANARVFIKYGSYTETSDCTPASGQTIYFDNPTITLNGARISTAGSSTAFGQATLTGTGTSTFRNFITITGANDNWGQCRLTITPTGDGLTAGSSNLIYPAALSAASYCSLNILMYNITFNNSTDAVVCVRSQGASVYNNYLITFVNIDNSGNKDVYGILTDSGTSKCLIEAIIDDINPAGGGTGRGVNISAGSNDNTLVGLSKNCDTNLVNGGTNTNTSAFNTA